MGRPSYVATPLLQRVLCAVVVMSVATRGCIGSCAGENDHPVDAASHVCFFQAFVLVPRVRPPYCDSTEHREQSPHITNVVVSLVLVTSRDPRSSHRLRSPRPTPEAPLLVIMSGTRSMSSSRGGGGKLPLVLMMLCCCAVVVAFPQFQDVIPNGHFVPCPPNVSGCVGEGAAATCPGVGHASCTGGSLPLNVFGAAFLNAKKAWTLELCMADRCAVGIVVYKIVPPQTQSLQRLTTRRLHPATETGSPTARSWRTRVATTRPSPRPPTATQASGTLHQMVAVHYDRVTARLRTRPATPPRGGCRIRFLRLTHSARPSGAHPLRVRGVPHDGNEEHTSAAAGSERLLLELLHLVEAAETASTWRTRCDLRRGCA